MRKKKLVEVQVFVKLDRVPTEAELEGLRVLFPEATLGYLEKWEREIITQLNPYNV